MILQYGQQECLTPRQIGPARAAEDIVICDDLIKEGEIIVPPDNAATVTIDRLRVKKVIIVDKDPNPFRRGFWDVDLKYVFEYKLTFREADGCPIHPINIRANSIFNKKITLFGSEGSDLTVSTDLFCSRRDSMTIEAEPFIWVESKGVALDAEIEFNRRRDCDDSGMSSRPSRVNVTIGLFTIIKLFRIVNLSVESKGFCIPDECDEISPLNPCEFFDNLDFPMDIFAPPQKKEFLAGVSNDIPRRDRCRDAERNQAQTQPQVQDSDSEHCRELERGIDFERGTIRNEDERDRDRGRIR